MKPNLLFILHVSPPVNGAAMVGDYISKSPIINRTYDIDYINLTTSFTLDKIGKGGIGKIQGTFKIQSKVLRALLSNRYELCYMTLTARGAGFYKDFFVVLLLKLFGKKIIYHFHNKGVQENSKKWYNHLLYRITFHNTQSILLAPTLYKDIERYVEKDKVHFCPNGIPDLMGKTLVKIEKTKKAEICQFLFLSNMMEEKGVFELLKACKILKAKKTAFQCHFIGAWSDISERSFMDLVDQYDLTNNILVHGKKYDAEKIQFFKNADIFILPTFYHNECFPLVLLEAMQHALPIISTKEGAISEMVVDGVTGVVITQKNTQELADRMEMLMNDPDLREKMGAAGRKRYEKLFTLTVFENKLKSILTDAIDKV
ncbi:glycosyltransferase family 4 protein [Sediminicola luteus]|uniref:Glycosyltransferase family 4 protein n=1 Tax=Sediminicola luteus TaxID=319238 RepID=A0ABV2TXT1_9FLAO